MAFHAKTTNLLTLWIFLGWAVYFTSCHATTAASLVQVDCSKSDSSVCVDRAFCGSFQDVEIKAVMCPHLCGFCNLTNNLDCTIPDKKGLCEGNFCDRIDKDLAESLCPHLCGYCGASASGLTTISVGITTIYEKECKDHVIHGKSCDSIADICDDAYGQEICAKHCGTCATPGHTHSAGHSTAATSTDDPTCVDHIYNHLRCEDVPSICKDAFAKRLCRKYCNECHVDHTLTHPPPQHSSTSSVSSQSTVVPPAATTSSTSSTSGTGTGTSTDTSTGTPPPLVSTCVDDIGNGFKCAWMPDLCDDMYGSFLCRRFCRKCIPTSNSTTPLYTSVAPGACADHVIGEFKCSQLPNVCTDSKARLLCPKYCGDCSDTTTTTVPSTTHAEPVCTDHFIHGRECSQVSGICGNEFGRQVCKKFCGLCTGPTADSVSGSVPPAGSCVDYVDHRLSCHSLHQVCSDPTQIGPQILCPRHCHICHAPTHAPIDAPSTTPTEPTTTTTSSGLTDCKDNMIYDVACDQIPSICSNPFSFVCRRFCGTCGLNYTHHTLPTSPGCMDRLGNGVTCQQLPNVCLDPLGPVFCPHFCGACVTTAGPVTTATMSTSSGTTVAVKTTTTLTTSGGCEDNVGEGESCDDPKYRDICSSKHADFFCPKHCGLCGSSASPTATGATHHHNTSPHQHTTSPHQHTTSSHQHTTSSHQHSTSPHHATTTLSHLDQCIDNVGLGMDCDELKNTGFCQDTFSRLVCRKTCGHCKGNATTPTTSATSATPQSTSTSTVTITTTPPTTIAPTSTPPITIAPPSTTTATTATTSASTTASTIPVTTPTTMTTESTTLSTTATTTPATTITTASTTTTTPVPCVDLLNPPLTCSDLDAQLKGSLCGDNYGRHSCPLYCKQCHCFSNLLPIDNPACFDRGDPIVCNLPGFCDDPYAKYACEKTCEICNPGCEDKLLKSGTDCMAWVGPGRIMADLNHLCSDSLGSKVCEKTCGCHGYCTN